MILFVDKKIAADKLQALCHAHFTIMVKFVADVERQILTVGGEMHADGETLLLEQGSNQSDLWGGNFYPWHEPAERCEFTSFINIRPVDDNNSMEVASPTVRNSLRALCERLLLGPDESLPEIP